MELVLCSLQESLLPTKIFIQGESFVSRQLSSLMVTEYQGASLEYQSLQFLQPGDTPMTCYPLQLTQEVSGEC